MTARPKRPYLLRALNDWIVDSDLTPYLLVDATGDQVQVPMEYVKDGRIVLNIAPSAVRDLLLGDDAVSFSARFSGRSFSVYVPVNQVMAIYARETSEGMMFETETALSAKLTDTTSGDDEPPPGAGPKNPGSHLKLVE